MKFMGTPMLLPGQYSPKNKSAGKSGTEFQGERNGMTHIMTPVLCTYVRNCSQSTHVLYTDLQRLTLLIQIKKKPEIKQAAISAE